MTPDLDSDDLDLLAQDWADRAPRGWKRCAKCGEEWAIGDESDCECEEWKLQPQISPLECTGMNGQPVKPGIAVMAQVSPSLKEMVKRAADDAGVSVSEWLRILIVEELKCG